MANQQDPKAMKEPMKPHGDKIDADKGRDNAVKDQKGKQSPDDTARVGGAAYAPHDLEAEKLAEKAGGNGTPEKE